jgi:hypothetical protein
MAGLSHQVFAFWRNSDAKEYCHALPRFGNRKEKCSSGAGRDNEAPAGITISR